MTKPTKTDKAVPLPIRRALDGIGDDLGTWRRLRGLTVVELAERAVVARSTLLRLESGRGASLEALLRGLRPWRARRTGRLA